MSENTRKEIREAFEADYFGTLSDCPAIDRDGDGYKAAHVQSAWGLWQAAWTASRQKALQEAAELCETMNHGAFGSHAYLSGIHDGALGCANRIRTLGGGTSKDGEHG